MISKLVYGSCLGLAALAALGVPLGSPAFAAETPAVETPVAKAPAVKVPAAKTPPAIHIDVPVVLKQAKVVFNIDHAVAAGVVPVSLKHMMLITGAFQKMGTKWKVVGVFYGDAGYMLLNDEKYNEVKWAKTGNPYKALLATLAKRGIQIEQCAVTMKANKWTNKDLLPMVKVNSGAELRLVQLGQQGYVKLSP